MEQAVLSFADKVFRIMRQGSSKLIDKHLLAAHSFIRSYSLIDNPLRIQLRRDLKLGRCGWFGLQQLNFEHANGVLPSRWQTEPRIQ